METIILSPDFVRLSAGSRCPCNYKLFRSQLGGIWEHTVESKEGTEKQRGNSHITHKSCLQQSYIQFADGFLAEQSKKQLEKGNEQQRTKLADYLHILNTWVNSEELQKDFMRWTT